MLQMGCTFINQLKHKHSHCGVNNLMATCTAFTSFNARCDSAAILTTCRFASVSATYENTLQVRVDSGASCVITPGVAATSPALFSIPVSLLELLRCCCCWASCLSRSRDVGAQVDSLKSMA